MKLIFVYNADSDLLSQTKDFVKKALDPDSYACNLCKVTYGTAVMKQEWKEFVNNSDFDIVFFHRDEFIEKYPNYLDEKLPAVFIDKDNNLETAISAEEINKINSIKELKDLVRGITT